MRDDLASYCQVGAGSYNWNDRAGDESVRSAARSIRTSSTTR